MRLATLVRWPVLVAAFCGAAGNARADPPRAIVAQYDGIIHPVAAEFVDDAITHAELSGADLVVLTLQTPGGLLDSTRTIVSRLIAARPVVVVFVGPSGARAASAGFIIALAADVTVMAPGTHIGAAHPVSAGGERPGNEAMDKKATEDTAAFARTLAEARHRNTELAAKAVTESLAFTEHEALGAAPPLIDLIAADVPALLRELDGRTITRFDGRTATLETTDIAIEEMRMTVRQRLLSAIAHPQVAYLLMSLGMLGLIVELWMPGAILPGVAGGLCLLLAFFAFQVLPVSAAGLLLIAFGAILLVLELKVPSYGVLGAGGAAALFFGSVMVTREVPEVRVGYGIIGPVVLALSGIFLALGRLAVHSQRWRPVTGVEGLVGKRGRTLTAIQPGHLGEVHVHGERWRAVSSTAIPAGHEVRVASVDGLTLHVDPGPAEPAQGVVP